MILNRIGCKKDTPHTARMIGLFPPHQVYYEPFFGAGGVFFQKPLAKYNWINDLDGEVMNFWQVLTHHKDEFAQLLATIPLHEALFTHWQENGETSPLLRALRFVFLSNFSLYGKGKTFRSSHNVISNRAAMLDMIEPLSTKLQRCVFRQRDFRDFFSDISIDEEHIPADKRFIYADPPYLHTTQVYNTPAWAEQDTIDLFDVLMIRGIPFAISEFDESLAVELAKERGLHITHLGERRNINNRATEVLITSYPVPKYIQTSIL